MWYVGQKVVCVQRGAFNHELTVGEVYVIADVTACNCRTRLHIGMFYSNHSRTKCAHDCGWAAASNDARKWFGAQCFRPLDSLGEAIERIEVEAAEEVKELQPA